jgi:secreted PhoX family phosphatase
MGNFAHEAIDIDPGTGIAYLTEDDNRGSSLFRFVPHDPHPRPGALRAGGVLQVLCVEDVSGYDADLATPGQQFGIIWKDVDPADPHSDALVKGGARFNRLEGCHFAGGAFWFSDTAGGEEGRGQIFRLVPLPGGDRLELFCEGSQANGLDGPDNLVLTAWGDVWFAEDGAGADRVMGVTPDGQVYEFARNRLNSTELCGPCFSPSGQTFFVNIQDPPITLAVTGPFPRRAPLQQHQMAVASPPPGLGPRISGELAEAALRLGMTELEAAAYDRLGITLT